MSGVVTKGGIPIGAITTAGKPIGGQSAQFQILRQNASRQQFKVLNTGQGNTVLQTVGGQVSVVNPGGAIIQGGIVTGSNVGQTLQLQQAGGQKVSIATVSGVSGSPGMVTNVASVATVQMTGTGQQQRTHFMKQVGTKQQMGRSVTETEMLLVKRQMINQAQATQGSPQQQQQQQNQQGSQQKTQILSQFTPSIQLQQSPGVGGQQHIATLVKTSGGTMATGGTVGMTLAQIKPGQLKGTLPNASTSVRQMQLQQIPIGQQQRKAAGKMTQITQVTGNTMSTSSAGGSVTGTVSGVTKGSPVGTAQLIVQNPKNLQPGTVTVQQIQQVMRQAQPSQIVLGKSVGRIIPVSVSSQPNARQTIQVIFPSHSIRNHEETYKFHLSIMRFTFRLCRRRLRKGSQPVRCVRTWPMPAWEPRIQSKWRPAPRPNKHKPFSMRCNSNNKCNVKTLVKICVCNRAARWLRLPFNPNNRINNCNPPNRPLFRSKICPNQSIRLLAPPPPPPLCNHRHRINCNR